MKNTAIELLNLVTLHCSFYDSASQRAFEVLEEIDQCDRTELGNIILGCLEDLENEFTSY
jgi:tRNA A37 methylthiotransferase MiaB